MSADSSPIRVMLVDDHAVVRGGLSAFLKVHDDLEMVGQAADGTEALQVCQQVQPDVILMDLMMPGMDGAQATRLIRDRCPEVRVIILTSFKEKDLIQEALEAGAIGYLLKNASADDLAEAIRAAHAGRSTLAPEVSQVLRLAERLERLAQSLIEAPPDPSQLADLLREHVPAMFPKSRIEIQVFGKDVLLHHPPGWTSPGQAVWDWIYTESEPSLFPPRQALPGETGEPPKQARLIVPIVLPEHDQTIGGIYIERSGEASLLEVSISLVQSLAAQIASVLHSAQLEEEAATRRRIEQELTLAGRIQMSLLPDRPPDLAGWQVEVALEPARETSGDFYDFIPLAGGRWGIVIADVADKGVGAALFMALSRTLIRTYAREYPERGDLVLSEVNERILSEARAGLFVTVFYAILDPSSGTLSYCNAGHPPPYLTDRQRASLRQLTRTGMALGVVEGERWEQRQVWLDTGDLLLLYTDGLTDALDPAGRSFGRLRVEAAIDSRPDASASALKDGLLSEVRRFAAGGPQADDLTLVLLVREA